MPLADPRQCKSPPTVSFSVGHVGTKPLKNQGVTGKGEEREYRTSRVGQSSSGEAVSEAKGSASVCADLPVRATQPSSPSSHCEAGLTLISGLSASNEVIKRAAQGPWK